MLAQLEVCNGKQVKRRHPDSGPESLSWFPVSHPLLQLMYSGLPFMQRAVPTSPGEHIPQDSTESHGTDATEGIPDWRCSKAERAAIIDVKSAQKHRCRLYE